MSVERGTSVSFTQKETLSDYSVFLQAEFKRAKIVCGYRLLYRFVCFVCFLSVKAAQRTKWDKQAVDEELKQLVFVLYSHAEKYQRGRHVPENWNGGHKGQIDPPSPTITPRHRKSLPVPVRNHKQIWKKRQMKWKQCSHRKLCTTNGVVIKHWLVWPKGHRTTFWFPSIQCDSLQQYKVLTHERKNAS